MVSLAPCVVSTAIGQDNNDVTVCVAKDSILRSPVSGVCPPGSQQIKLSGPDLKKPDADDDDSLGPTKKPDEPKSDSLADIEQRLSSLENASVFEVVNQKGSVIFGVSPGKAQLYNSDGVVVAAMSAAPEGGGFAARTPDSKVRTFLRASGALVGLRLREGDFTRLDLGRQKAGNYAFKVPLGDDKVIAGIGESKAGTGAIVVSDMSGRIRAETVVSDGKGWVNIFNSGGAGIASLTESVGGGGLLVLTDASSRAMVMMKGNRGYGVVMAFPPGLLYAPKSGFPGSYMLGCAAGPACVP